MDNRFSGWLNEQMQKNNWSQSDFARASGLSRQVISYYLSDKSKSPDVEHAYAGRNDTIEADVRLICKRAGIAYLSPHKLRHGHVVYALKLARNMAEAKAISQNVMHASVVITDQVYGRMITDDVRDIIARLGKSNSSP